ncbi:MAG TPA: hypothetical protein VFH66_08470 [Mycobacteriales bacterium]|nr:hypothetical protein [Mycobacteriales bacterium]
MDRRPRRISHQRVRQELGEAEELVRLHPEQVQLQLGLSVSAGTIAGPPAGEGERPLTTRALLPLALASVGGPLALAALYAPGAVSDVTGSGGSIAIAGAIAFVAPLAIWLRYSRDIASSGGLFAFVAAAVGRPVALVQAALWLASYVLYLLYTSAYVVYDLLPPVWPGIQSWRPAFAALLPAVIALTVVSGRRVAFGAIAVLGLVQVPLLVLLDVVAVRHAPTAAAFAGRVNGDTTHATAEVATLFVCGSLPLFLGGEVAAPRRAFRLALPVAFAVAAVGVLLAVYPLAHDRAFARASSPGMSLVRADVGAAAGDAVGLGVAASVIAVMLLEYVAITRLLRAVAGVEIRTSTRWLGAALVLAGPASLLFDPDRFYQALLRPSLVLLWLSQLVVVVVFPLFVARRGGIRPWHLLATAVAAALATFGVVTAAVNAST